MKLPAYLFQISVTPDSPEKENEFTEFRWIQMLTGLYEDGPPTSTEWVSFLLVPTPYRGKHWLEKYWLYAKRFDYRNTVHNSQEMGRWIVSNNLTDTDSSLLADGWSLVDKIRTFFSSLNNRGPYTTFTLYEGKWLELWSHDGSAYGFTLFRVLSCETPVTTPDEKFARMRQKMRQLTTPPKTKIQSPTTGQTIRITKLNWQILPPGWLENPGKLKSVGLTKPKIVNKRRLERLRFLERLGPRNWYAGTSLGQNIYLAAEFEGVVVADSAIVGNALYYTFEEKWQDVFSLSKGRALKAGAKRIVHLGDWQLKCHQVIAQGKGEMIVSVAETSNST